MPEDKAQDNFTDPDSRIMKRAGGGFDASYNAQTAVDDAAHIIVAADQVRSELHRARSAMLERFGALEVLTADADEWFEESGPLHYAEHLPELEAWIRAHPR